MVGEDLGVVSVRVTVRVRVTMNRRYTHCADLPPAVTLDGWSWLGSSLWVGLAFGSGLGLGMVRAWVRGTINRRYAHCADLPPAVTLDGEGQGQG